MLQLRSVESELHRELQAEAMCVGEPLSVHEVSSIRGLLQSDISQGFVSLTSSYVSCSNRGSSQSTDSASATTLELEIHAKYL